ncbi:hypothetical protein RND71_042513 [Anisodus tanguticus]|uniref:Uncharacterized protein n=1 Tax=Anisodus tanguticus TaxID=243964 RepID=A0AAE1QRL0_9SOLA|nr:hypothetical protein RND71_042513 [Anisodus tanguticus]
MTVVVGTVEEQGMPNSRGHVGQCWTTTNLPANFKENSKNDKTTSKSLHERSSYEEECLAEEPKPSNEQRQEIDFEKDQSTSCVLSSKSEMFNACDIHSSALFCLDDLKHRVGCTLFPKITVGNFLNYKPSSFTLLHFEETFNLLESEEQSLASKQFPSIPKQFPNLASKIKGGAAPLPSQFSLAKCIMISVWEIEVLRLEVNTRLIYKESFPTDICELERKI